MVEQVFDIVMYHEVIKSGYIAPSKSNCRKLF